jgi:hypothetical protein
MPLISKKRSEEIANSAETRGTGGGNVLPMGVHVLKVTAVNGQHSQAEGIPMVKITYQDLKEEYWSIDEYFKIDEGKGPEYLALRLKPFGAHNFGEVETLDDLVRYVSKNLLNKHIKAAISHEQRLYKKTPETWYKNVQARIAYTGAVDEDMKFDVSQGLKVLDPAQQKEWDDYVAARADGGTPAPAAVKTMTEAEDIEDIAKVPEEKPKPKAKAKTKVNLEEDDDDDLAILNKKPGKVAQAEAVAKKADSTDEKDELGFLND